MNWISTILITGSLEHGDFVRGCDQLQRFKRFSLEPVPKIGGCTEITFTKGGQKGHKFTLCLCRGDLCNKFTTTTETTTTTTTNTTTTTTGGDCECECKCKPKDWRNGRWSDQWSHNNNSNYDCLYWFLKKVNERIFWL